MACKILCQVPSLSLIIRLQIPFGFSELEKEFGKYNFNDACTSQLPHFFSFVGTKNIINWIFFPPEHGKESRSEIRLFYFDSIYFYFFNNFEVLWFGKWFMEILKAFIICFIIKINYKIKF